METKLRTLWWSRRLRVVNELAGFMFLVVLLCPYRMMGLALEYTVEGTLVHVEFVASGQEVVRFEEDFKVSVLGDYWFISEKREEKRKPFYKKTGFDGTNTYQLNRFPVQTQAPGKRLNVLDYGSVRSSDMPAPELLFCTSQLWLAFASAGSFSSASTGLVRPVWVLYESGLWQTGFKVSAKWKLAEKPPHLPESVAYYDEGKTHPTDGSKPFVLSPGFTNVIYTTAFTNLDGMALPFQFSLVRSNARYVPNGKRQSEVRIAATDVAVVRKISASSEVHSFVPELRGTVHISDWRVSGYEVSYLVTNGLWGLMPYSELLQRHERARPATTVDAGGEISGKRAATILAMLLATGAFAWVLRECSRKPAS